jgi:NAD(P)-dependent dehydrogenase (short-subunit alcohol dehydrogenase family)
MRGLEGRAVLVSGGGGGIGRATSRRFLEEGARVFLTALESDEADAVAEELRPIGWIQGARCDVRNEEEVASVVERADDALGGIDVLANNAGVAWKEPFLEISTESWDRMMKVNLRGMFLMAQAAARRIIERGRAGCIVNMASTNAFGGEENFAHYNASKAGVLLLTKTMAVELGPQGVRVNCICPGFIDTPLNRHLAGEEEMAAYERERIPLGRRGNAEEVGAAFAFLASDDASFVHGAALVVDGGQTAAM